MDQFSGSRSTALEIYHNRYLNNLYQTHERNAVRFAYVALIPGAGGGALTILIFWFAGRQIGRDEHVRGSRLVSKKELIRWSKQKWKVYNRGIGKQDAPPPRYSVSGIPFPPTAIEAQTGIFGTVGVGKTTTFKELLTTVRAHGGRAIIHDKMGSMVRDYYDPATDIILNPFDARSRGWTPFLEAETPEQLAQIAEVLIPVRPGDKDPFWSQTARLVFEYVARQLLKRGKTTNKDLRDAIMNLPAKELQELLEGTPGEHFINKDIEKTSSNIRANMITELRFLELLRDDAQAFSIRDWVKHRKQNPGFVFLTSDGEHAAATRNIISTLIEVASNALMTCDESYEPQLWFFIDELPNCQYRRKKGPFAGVKVGQLRCRALLGVLPIKLTRDKAHVGQRPTSIKFRPGSGSGVSALF